MPIEQDFTIYSAMREYETEEERLYLLIEGAGEHTLAKKRLFERADLRYAPVYVGTDFEPLVHISPLLIIPEKRDPFIQWFVEEAAPQGAGIILFSRFDEKLVIKHLQGMLEVILPSRDFAAFRYHDPAVFDHYAMNVNEQARMRLLGPLTSIIWSRRLAKRDSRGMPLHEWREIFAPPRNLSQEDALRLSRQPPIEITKEQLAAFEQAMYDDLANRLQNMPVA